MEDRLKIWKEQRETLFLKPTSDVFLDKEKDKIIAMGTCFCAEINCVLQGSGFDVYPKYSNSRLPSWAHEIKYPYSFQFYSPPTVLQELSWAFGESERNIDDIWEHQSPDEYPKRGDKYQDPCRCMMFSNKKKKLIELMLEQDEIMKRDLKEVNTFILFLGHNEPWKTMRGQWCCLESKCMQKTKCSLNILSFEEYFNYIVKIVDIIHKHKCNPKIYMGVCPVPLSKTYREDIDVISATLEIKSMANICVNQISKKYDSVIKIPSYEVQTRLGKDMYKPDYRHVKQDIIEKITYKYLIGKHQ